MPSHLIAPCNDTAWMTTNQLNSTNNHDLRTGEAKIAMPEVIVLEKVWDRSKKMRDTYSLSLRSDTGASDALKELDLLESVNALRSADYPTLTGFIMATSSNGSFERVEN